MASPEAMEKLRAVLDYVPEDAGERLPGDPQEYYDALTHRLHRSVAVTRLVHRKVLVEQVDDADLQEPPGPVWVPPPPVDVATPAYAPPPAPLPAAYARAATEAVTVVEASPPTGYQDPPRVAPVPGATASGSDEWFDVVHREGEGGEMEPVEAEMAFSDAEWKDLEAGPVDVQPVEEPPAWEQPPEDVPADPALTPFEEPGEVVEPMEEEAAAPTGPSATEELLSETPAYRETELEVVGYEDEPPAPWQPPPPAEVPMADTELEILEEGEEPPPPGGPIAYQQGGYTLFHRVQRGADGVLRDTYFFSPEAWLPDAEPCQVPQGHEVTVNPQTGAPAIRRTAPRVVTLADMSGAGIGPLMAERLERAGVYSAEDLVRADAAALSEQARIREGLLRDYKAIAGLLQVEGLTPAEAAALVHAGVRDLDDLRSADPVATAAAMEQAARQHHLNLPTLATATRVRAWQDGARRR